MESSTISGFQWNRCDKRCQKIGGHLPFIKTRQDEEHLKAVMLGRQAPYELYMAPCKTVSPVCAVFIGMNPYKVCYIHYKNLPIVSELLDKQRYSM